MEVSGPDYTDPASRKSQADTTADTSSSKDGIFTKFLTQAAEHFNGTTTAGFKPLSGGDRTSTNIERAERAEEPARSERPDEPEESLRADRPDRPERQDQGARPEANRTNNNETVENNDNNDHVEAAPVADTHADDRPQPKGHDAAQSRAENGAEMVAEHAQGDDALENLPLIASVVPQMGGEIGKLLKSTNGIATQSANNANTVSTVAAQATDAAKAALGATQQVAVKAEASGSKSEKVSSKLTLDSDVDPETIIKASQSKGSGSNISVSVTKTSEPVVSRPMNTLIQDPAMGEVMAKAGQAASDSLRRPMGEMMMADDGVDVDGLPTHGRPQATGIANAMAKTQGNPSAENAGQALSKAMTNGEAQPQNTAGPFGAAVRAAAVANPNAAVTSPTTTVSGETQQVGNVTQASGPDARLTASQNAASTAAAKRPAPPPAPPQEQVAIHIRKAISEGLDRINIQLKPGTMGRVEVKLDLSHDGRVVAVVSAEKSDTLEMLQRDSRGLEKALADAGLKTDSGSLSFNLRGENGTDAGNADKNQTAGPGEDAAGLDSKTDESSNVAAAPQMIIEDDMIDIRI